MGGTRPSRFEVGVERSAAYAVVRAAGELDIATAPDFEAVVRSELADGGGDLYVDLRAIEFLDSTGLRALIQGHRLAQERGRGYHLVRGSAADRVLELTRVDEHIDVVDAIPGE
jgi:anti-anti-sigma factor